MSARKDITDFHLGETWTIDALCKDADGAPINLTGASATFKVNGPSANVLTLSVGAGITITDGPAGSLKIIVPPASQTPFQVKGQYGYELRIVEASGAASVQCEGAFKLKHSLTPPV
jgi:hypothetical protein